MFTVWKSNCLEGKTIAKQKFYVVWNGRKTGIFTSWAECIAQIDGFPNAKYKAFTSRELAEEAFQRGEVKKISTSYESYIEESISVEAACSGNPGPMEYRGVYTKNGMEIFHHGPVQNGTNNIGEFLAIVHALALLKQKNSRMPIYSDSATAIKWVKDKRVNTTLVRDESTEEIWNLIDRATYWLHHNDYENVLLKWDTKKWGEIKADFGRK